MLIQLLIPYNKIWGTKAATLTISIVVAQYKAVITGQTNLTGTITTVVARLY